MSSSFDQIEEDVMQRRFTDQQHYLTSSLFECLFLFHVSVLATIFLFSFLNRRKQVCRSQKSLELFLLNQVSSLYIFPCHSSKFYPYCYHPLDVQSLKLRFYIVDFCAVCRNLSPGLLRCPHTSISKSNTVLLFF